MQTQKEITVGQIWEEVDPRLIRKVRVVEVASLEGPKGILIENVESGRKNWASSSRFNGKRGGYRLIWGQFGYRKLLYVKLIFYHFWFFWKRNILDVKTVMRGH
ncbi:hypothetical protein [Escherichia coli]|uniref:hypothetical protein n=1 Tax=Escherichia coli TaxID=562 RepID=UPI00202CB658|nr:hypothetical protein [Escherichia coli]